MENINRNINDLEDSASMKLMQIAKKLNEQGIEVNDLAGGEPNFDTPKKISDKLVESLTAGHTHYCVGKGYLPLRKAISKKLKDENNLDHGADEIIITPGAKYAIYLTIATLINPGDEVIILAPFWVSYKQIILACGGIPKIVQLDYKNGYKIDKKLIEGQITTKTKLIITNYPNNPTGKVLSFEELNILKDIILKYRIYIISDEIYEKIVFNNIKHLSVGSIPEISKYVITINGFSKCTAMTGWRIGYVAANIDLINAMYKLFVHTITGVSTFIQEASVSVFDCNSEIQEMKKYYEENKNYLFKEINKISKFSCLEPEGTFYIWIRVDTKMSSTELSELLLEKEKLTVVPGIAYGEINACYIRCSIATSKEILMKGVEAFKNISQYI